jgi:phage shock protein A
MNVFKRLFKVGEAEAHSAMDQLENPIKMTEQGIRDLKKDLDESLKAMAEVKAMAIRSKNDFQTNKNKAQDYENKAIQLLKKAEAGELDASDGDRLAGEALAKKEEFEGNVTQLDGKIKKLRSDVSTFENELRTLKARVKVSEATSKVNKQMANIDTNSTVAMLERMKEKVAQQEALADAYGEIAGESKSLDNEIDAALGDNSNVKAADDLAAMKAKLGLKK